MKRLANYRAYRAGDVLRTCAGLLDADDLFEN